MQSGDHINHFSRAENQVKYLIKLNTKVWEREKERCLLWSVFKTYVNHLRHKERQPG